MSQLQAHHQSKQTSTNASRFHPFLYTHPHSLAKAFVIKEYLFSFGCHTFGYVAPKLLCVDLDELQARLDGRKVQIKRAMLCMVVGGQVPKQPGREEMALFTGEHRPGSSQDLWS